MSVEARIAGLGFKLSKSPKPAWSYIPARKSGSLVFVSGQIPKKLIDGDAVTQKGKVGTDVTLEHAQECARLCAIAILSVLKDAIGELDRVRAVLKVDGFVNCVDTFTDHPLVINGCSDLFVDVFGPEIGSHARAAVGCSSLPQGVPVEVSAVFEVRE